MSLMVIGNNKINYQPLSFRPALKDVILLSVVIITDFLRLRFKGPSRNTL
ncbi:hypothetical protein H0X06_00135 [Candidatus Dependentiae bacterium]|nr:hypothetical protein [Candidatus Dependentiae bacterium]